MWWYNENINLSFSSYDLVVLVNGKINIQITQWNNHSHCKEHHLNFKKWYWEHILLKWYYVMPMSDHIQCIGVSAECDPVNINCTKSSVVWREWSYPCCQKETQQLPIPIQSFFRWGAEEILLTNSVLENGRQFRMRICK